MYLRVKGALKICIVYIIDWLKTSSSNKVISSGIIKIIMELINNS